MFVMFKKNELKFFYSTFCQHCLYCGNNLELSNDQMTIKRDKPTTNGMNQSGERAIGHNIIKSDGNIVAKWIFKINNIGNMLYCGNIILCL